MASTRKPFLRFPLHICHSYFSTHSQLPFSLMWHATTTCHAGTHTPHRHLHGKFRLCPCLQLHSTTDMWDSHVRVIFNLKHPVGVLDRQTYQGGTRGSRLCDEDRDRETENSKVCTRTRDTRFIQVQVARVASPTSCLGDQVWRPALG
jgi:hypothetical protein